MLGEFDCGSGGGGLLKLVLAAKIQLYMRLYGDYSSLRVSVARL